MSRMDREPCPYRIVDDAGGAFAFGKKNLLDSELKFFLF